MNTFCTIITASHLSFAKALHASLQKQVPGISLQVLVVDGNNFESINNLTLHSIDALARSPYLKSIEKKSSHTNTDNLRWALKPVFIGYLLEKGFTRVIFTDPDIYFVGHFNFLFDQLEKNNVLLTPHWRNPDPVNNEDGFFSIFKDGLYNAGFIGVNEKGGEAMAWWAAVCHYKMDRRPELGIYDDQKYLDVLPLEFPGTEIVRHQGCNLASWNIDTCKREIINGKLMINKIYEPIFIHFTKDTVINILNNNDELLKPFLNDYIQTLKNENIDLVKDLYKLDHSKFNSPLYSIKHKLRLRSRLKRFLFKLAEKL